MAQVEKISVVCFFLDDDSIKMKYFQGKPEEVISKIHKFWRVKTTIQEWQQTLLKTHKLYLEIPISRYFDVNGESERNKAVKIIGLLGYGLHIFANVALGVNWIQWNDGRKTYVEKEFREWVEKRRKPIRVN